MANNKFVSTATPPIKPLHGGRQPALSPLPDQRRLPDWAKWGQMLSARLWELVALSLNIEPTSLRGYDPRPISGDIFDDCPKDFQSRMDIASNHFRNGKLITCEVRYDTPHSEFLIMVFAKWASSVGWDLPGQFPAGQISKRLPKKSGSKKAYQERIDEFRNHNPPSRADDNEWAKKQGF